MVPLYHIIWRGTIDLLVAYHFFVIYTLTSLLLVNHFRRFHNFNSFMDRFLKRPAPPTLVNDVISPKSKKPNLSAKQGDVSAAFRAQEFSSSTYASGDKLFCRFCNVVIDHHRKFIIKRHLESKVWTPIYFLFILQPLY